MAVDVRAQLPLLLRHRERQPRLRLAPRSGAASGPRPGPPPTPRPPGSPADPPAPGASPPAARPRPAGRSRHQQRRHPARQREPGRHRPRVAPPARQHRHLDPQPPRLQRRLQRAAAPRDVGHHRDHAPVGPGESRQHRQRGALCPRRSRTPAGGSAAGGGGPARPCSSSPSRTSARRSSPPTRSGQATSQAWAHCPGQDVADRDLLERVDRHPRADQPLPALDLQRDRARRGARRARCPPPARPCGSRSPRALTPPERSRTCRCRPCPTRVGDSSSAPGSTSRTGGLPRPNGARASSASAVAEGEVARADHGVHRRAPGRGRSPRGRPRRPASGRRGTGRSGRPAAPGPPRRGARPSA